MSGDTTQLLLNNYLTRYRIEERLGVGGMARVYRGVDLNLDRTVAIKILHDYLSDDAEFKERFEREARSIASLSHPNIIQIYDFNSIQRGDDTFHYMVMPYLPGKTLGEVLRDLCSEERCMTIERAREILFDLTGALSYAHARGLVHRDIKPANILFDESSRAILTDFGIAQLAQNTRLTREGVTIGTPTYMSPEQATGEPVDARSDLYALGVIMYELLAGQPPFADDGSISVLLKHLNEPPPPLSQRAPHLDNPHLDSVIYKALAKYPEDRYQTAQEFEDDLRLAFIGESPAAPLVTPTTRLETPTGPRTMAGPEQSTPAAPAQRKPPNLNDRMPLAMFGIGVIVIMLLLTLGILSRQGSSAAASDAAQNAGQVADVEVAGSPDDPLYFVSDFSGDDPYRNSWPTSELNNLTRGLTSDGYYRISNQRPGQAIATLFEQADVTYEDVYVEMDAVLEASSADNSAYGVIFRYIDQNNYNVFAVDGMGRYSIWVRANGRWNELRQLDEEWTDHPAINPVGERNRVAIEVFGDELIGFVNDERVVSVTDTTFAEGGIGIYIASPDDGEANVTVDRYETISAVESMTGVNSMTGDDEGVSSMTGEN
jgi:serine/threonine protein kinase